MPYYHTSGGSILEIDLPDPRHPHAVQRHEEQVAKGELIELDPSTVEAYEDQGATKLRLRATPEPEAPRRGRPPKSEAPAPEE